ncbi:hypothetical protein CVT24_004645 [Panaeolus cyanescens]|uniref:G domain-containing protein n=1 Tax=Panaeolus cyanescens TaxID=181874 RepID=A0A409YSN3_9AGAR|nr:hypothetical protein CVT24_004645 [Panaeolus cyanescens]
MSTSEYSHLKISGPVSARRLEKGEKFIKRRRLILLLGLTGTGKSSFIERLSGDTTHDISGNSLDSVTQDIVPYEVTNLRDAPPLSEQVYLIDTPGVCDTQLSELRLVTSLQAWIKTASLPTVVLYFHRITDKRLCGSQRKILNIIRGLVGEPKTYKTWTGIVTTMWDMVPEHQLAAAEERLRCLKENHFKNICGMDVRVDDNVLRFYNTKESTLQVINDAVRCWSYAGVILVRDPPLQRFQGDKLRQSPFGPPLFELLQERIEGLEQRIQMLNEDLAQEGTLDNPELTNILIQDKVSAQQVLEEMKRDREAYLSLAENLPKPSTGRRITNYLKNKFI